MNAQTQENGAHAQTRGRGRGSRVSGRFRQRPNPTTRPAGASNVPGSKIGPNRLLEPEWVKDNVLKDKVFVLWLGSGQTGTQQWTFHHPIGHTDMDDTEWVATPSRDIDYLLQRRESESLASWKRKAELAKRQQVLRSRTGRGLDASGQEVWTFENAPEIHPVIHTCITAAKAAGAKESAWLDYADSAVRTAEQQFKEALRKQEIPEAWLKENPQPSYETMGGPLGDQPQKAVPYLKGLSLSAARDKVTMTAIGYESDSNSDDEPEPIQVRGGS